MPKISFDTKLVAEDSPLKLTTRSLRRQGFFDDYRDGMFFFRDPCRAWATVTLKPNEWSVLALTYNLYDSKTKESFTETREILMNWSRPNYGGKRWWLICTVCAHYATTLYWDERHWVCPRHVTYESSSSFRRDEAPFITYSRNQKVLDAYRRTNKRAFYAGKLTRSGRKMAKLYDRQEAVMRSALAYTRETIKLLRERGAL